MRIKSNRLLAAAIVGLLSGSTSAFATNGSFVIGFGAAAEGVGGAAVAFPQDAMAAGANPAGIGDFASPHFVMGGTFFLPNRCAGEVGLFAGSPDANGNVHCQESGSNIFLIPGMGFVWPFDDHLTIGFAALGAGGGNSTYSQNFFTNDPSATKFLGVDLVQLIVPITAAWKFNETHTVGLSIVPARQRFQAQGLQAFKAYSTPNDGDAYVTNNGHDFANGLGMRVGWMGHFMDDQLTLGATWASKVYMQKFEHYRGLFAERGSFDIPENYAVGIAYKVTPKMTAAFDFQKILFSGVPSIGNLGPTNILYSGDPICASAVATCKLGTPGGMGFGWKDMDVYKIGVAYKEAFPALFDDKLTLRIGYNYGKNPVPDSQLLFSTLAPAIVEKHVTFGATYKLGEQSILGFGSEGEFTFAYVKARTNRQHADLLFDNTTPVAAVAEMDIDSLTFAYTLKF